MIIHILVLSIKYSTLTDRIAHYFKVVKGFLALFALLQKKPFNRVEIVDYEFAA